MSNDTTMLSTLMRMIDQHYVYNARYPESIEVSVPVNELIQQDIRRLRMPPQHIEELFKFKGVNLVVTESRELSIKVIQGEKF